MLLSNPPRLTSAIIWLILLAFTIPTMIISLTLEKTTLIEWTIMLQPLSIHLTLPIILDPAGLMFSCTILFISANIMQFSTFYMNHDPLIHRFCQIMALFVTSMNLLIFIPHLFFLLLGWDGLGMTSFILVIYYQNPKSLAAGMITALTNRIGDAMILIAIGLTINQGHWHTLNLSPSHLTLLSTLAILLAAMTKSAQMPFSSWLPAAMAAPTPVSALVHSSTLVTAGIFLLIRFFPSLSHIPPFKPILLLTASTTLIMASLSAMTEMDMKKIIALSTLSQLALMTLSLSLNLPNLALFHLLTHAMFKALLFLTAGTTITKSLHTQDLRHLSQTTSQSPLLSSAMTIALLALMGTPFLSAFYSKDLILETTSSSISNILAIFALLMSMALTSFYSTRFLLSVMLTPNLTPPLLSPEPNTINTSLPATLMSLSSIITGTVLSWSLFSPTPIPPLPPLLKILPSLCLLLGSLSAWTSTTNKHLSKKHTPLPFLLSFSSSMWFLTPLSSQHTMKYPLKLSHLLLKIMDQGWNETLGGQGTKTLSKSITHFIQPWQNNIITTHLSMFMLTLAPLLFIPYTT